MLAEKLMHRTTVAGQVRGYAVLCIKGHQATGGGSEN